MRPPPVPHANSPARSFRLRRPRPRSDASPAIRHPRRAARTVHSHCVLHCACHPSVRRHELPYHSFLPLPGRCQPASGYRSRRLHPNPQIRSPSIPKGSHHPLGKRSDAPIPSRLSPHYSPTLFTLSFRSSFRHNHPELIFPERYRDLQHVQLIVRPYIPKPCFGIPSLRSVTFN